MKKLILTVIASFLLLQVTDAQLFQYGVKAGVGFSSMKIDDITGIVDGADVYDLITGDAVAGYHIGIQTRINIAMIYVQPEVYFNAGGGTVEQVVAGGATSALSVKFSRVDIPLLVGAKLGPVRINVGPVGSYVLSETNDLTDLVADYEIFTNAMTWGFQAGLGVDLMKKVTIDARYEGSLSRLGDNLTISGQDFEMDARPSQWILSLGVWF